jgi:hypothetical protein
VIGGLAEEAPSVAVGDTEQIAELLAGKPRSSFGVLAD